MYIPKRVLCVMDLSTVGRSSLEVVISVLSSCGIQACPLPTALYSTHTKGFGVPVKKNTITFCQDTLSHYVKSNIMFDAIYIGYLQGTEQFDIALQAFNNWPKAFKIVDPAIADNGKLYSGMSKQDIKNMHILCSKANLITPNITESQLLSNRPTKNPTEQEVINLLKDLCNLAPCTVITSVPVKKGFLGISCGEIKNNHHFYATHYTTPHVPENYPGTGDLFTSALIGLLLQNISLSKSIEKVSYFVGQAVKDTFLQGGDSKQGVWFEPHLHLLTQTIMKNNEGDA